MRILLLNDNPVVRKLVALSAQKTKDDLDVIWSLDEIEHPHYDLLIVDDAIYSDEAMVQLKAKMSFKSSLLMATRGVATPAGFDKVINKPFLPTDLVELFVGIANTLPDLDVESVETSSDDTTEELLDNLVEDESRNSDLEEYNLDDLLDEDTPLKTNVLDSQEVEELQGLLDDTEDEDIEEFDGAQLEAHDELLMDDLDEGSNEISIPNFEIEELEDEKTDTLEDELSDDELEAMLLSGSVQAELPKEDELDLGALLSDISSDELSDEPLSDDDFDDLEKQIQEAMGKLEPEDLEQPLDNIGLDDLVLDDMDDELETIDNSVIVDDDKLDITVLDTIGDDEEDLVVIEEDDELLGEELASEAFEDGVNTVNEDDLEEKLDDVTVLEDIEGLDSLEELAELEEIESLDGLDDLDGLNEREIRLAIGEEVDDEEFEMRAGDSEHSALDVEALSEAMGKLPALALDELDLMEEEAIENHSPATGMEALQSLLKALSNDEVAKSLKGLNISININFGNDK